MDEPKTDKQQAYDDGYRDGLSEGDTEIERLEKGGSQMSAELTYLHGVLYCALGKVFPSDIGCEKHEVVLDIKQLEKEREWLLNRCVLRGMWTQTICKSDDELEKYIVERMQQALKDTT